MKILFSKSLIHIFFLLLITFLYSCEDEAVEPVEMDEAGDLVSYQITETLEASQLRGLIRLFDPSQNTDAVQYDVDIYEVIYLTTYQGELTEASGLVCVPVDAETVAFPVFLGFHASISSQTEAPSNYTGPFSTGLDLFTAVGFITVIPDYLGFGAAAEVPHPYLVNESVTRVSTDMVLATEEMMAELEQQYQKQINMAGYSQGAYNAMATLYAIENEGLLPEWEVTATAVGGGVYDLNYLTDFIIEEDTYSSPELLSYLVWSYHEYYELEGGYDNYFQEPYAAMIPQLFDGTNSLGNIKNELTTDLTALMQPDFLASLRGPEVHPIEEILAENSISSWQANSPIHMYHAPADEVLDISNSLNFYQALQEANAGELEFTRLESADSHSGGAVPMLINTLNWLLSFQEISS